MLRTARVAASIVVRGLIDLIIDPIAHMLLIALAAALIYLMGSEPWRGFTP